MKGSAMAMDNSRSETVHPAVYLKVWLGLLAFTGLTVYAASIPMGPYNTLVALLIATAKASLVALFFMHLKYDDRRFHIMISMLVLTMLIIFSLTYLDTTVRSVIP